MGGKVGLICSSCWSGKFTSQSGSVIGRDPLPSRAVSTSQLPQKTLTQSPPTHISTLPLPRSSGVAHRQQPLPVHQSTLQSAKQDNMNLNNSQALKAVSSGDVRLNSTLESRISSPSVHSTQRLVSPSSHLRVISPIDHRVSSPSDSERQLHSPSERSMTSPLRREVDRGGGDLRQIQRVRECIELLHKRNNINSRRSGRGKSTGSGSLVQVSAGELLGRTHEELVLLLIQLRRQSATLCKAMETCQMEIEAQARLVELDTPSRLENLQKQEKLEKHLLDLEKEYEKGKPLENLVANMLKLGSLYNRNAGNGNVSGSRHDLLQENREHRDRLEFNQRVEEQRLLAQERRDWDRLSPDHGQLQAKVQQLYKTDRLLQEESGTVHSLQQDKEILQKALESLRYKLQGTRNSPSEVEHYRMQQLLLERELSKVRMLLARHSKKLEETVAENDRLEQDLVVLRQKLQPSRRYVGNLPRESTGTTAAWEAELAQQHVSDLKRQRQELSNQIRQLKEQIRPQSSTTPQVHHSKKRTGGSWFETDLDSGITRDHGLDFSPASPALSSSPHSSHHSQSPLYKESAMPYKDAYRYSPPRQTQQIQQQQHQQQHSPQNHISALSPQLREQIQQHQLKQQLLKDQIQGKGSPIQNNIPLYVNTDLRRQDENKHYESPTNGPIPPEYIPPPPPPPPSEDALLINGNYGQDDNKFSGLMHNREKQEIKTVRIVKRESERRQRDRGDRTGLGIPLMNGLAAPGGAKRIGEDELGGSQQFEKAQLGRVIEESPISHAQSTVQLSEIDEVQFQRSMSLPRGFGGQRPHPAVHQVPVLPPPRSDSMNALKNMMARRHRVRFENQDGSSDSTLSPHTESPSSSSYVPMSSPNYSMSPPYSPNQQNYQVQNYQLQNYQAQNYQAQTYQAPNYQAQNYQAQNYQAQNYQAQNYQIRNQNPHHQVQYYPQYGSTFGGSMSSIKSESLGGILSPGPMSPISLTSPMSPVSPTTLTCHERLFGSVASINSIQESPQLSPIFKSEAAKQIIKEMAEKKPDGPRRRQVPRAKRRHYTVSSIKPVFDLEDTISKMGMGRARDDLDMERALRPRINAPDVVRSTLSHKELKYNESTIDQLLGTPNKIIIPERYIPEKTPELTAEEREQRLKKVESIRKMLSETGVTAPEGGEDEKNVEKSDTLKRKVAEEKRQREHILQLNQILAKQVMEKSKMVAGNQAH